MCVLQREKANQGCLRACSVRKRFVGFFSIIFLMKSLAVETRHEQLIITSVRWPAAYNNIRLFTYSDVCLHFIYATAAVISNTPVMLTLIIILRQRQMKPDCCHFLWHSRSMWSAQETKHSSQNAIQKCKSSAKIFTIASWYIKINWNTKKEVQSA